MKSICNLSEFIERSGGVNDINISFFNVYYKKKIFPYSFF